MMTEIEPEHLREHLSRQWEIDLPEDPDWARLEAALQAQLRHLLDHDFNRLVNAMYRLDIPETQFNSALTQATPEGKRPNQTTVALRLAKLVLARERRRLATWHRYRDQQT
ncbi:MAG: hypothetical protein AAF570_10970 [Bacteroidota bacterium]